MKKILVIVSVLGLVVFNSLNTLAQADTTTNDTTSTTISTGAQDSIAYPSNEVQDIAVVEEQLADGVPMHQILKEKFMEGGVEWMSPLLICLILGLSIIIERIIYLNLSSVNTKKLLEKVEEALNNGGIEAAKDICRETRGPVASIFYQGLSRSEEGIDVVEKSVIAYGSVQSGNLENGLSWVSLFISLAPMLGFMGTVVGMIDAFDSIQAAGDIAPSAVAGGIKVALLTTVGGLIVAVILQLFYNYIVSKIDSIVISMEDASISLIDILTKFLKKK